MVTIHSFSSMRCSTVCIISYSQSHLGANCGKKLRKITRIRLNLCLSFSPWTSAIVEMIELQNCPKLQEVMQNKRQQTKLKMKVQTNGRKWCTIKLKLWNPNLAWCNSKIVKNMQSNYESSSLVLVMGRRCTGVIAVTLRQPHGDLRRRQTQRNDGVLDVCGCSVCAPRAEV